MSFIVYIILVPLVLCEENVLNLLEVRQDIADTSCFAQSSKSNISYKTFYDTIRHSVSKDYDIIYPQTKVFCYQNYVDSSLICTGQKLLGHTLLEHCCQNHSERGYWGQQSYCQQCQEGIYGEPPSEQLQNPPFRIRCHSQLKYPQDYFTWCVHVLSQKYNISGCMNASGIITQTPAAKLISLLSLFKIDLLSQSNLGELYVTKLDPLLHGALVSCSVNKTMAISFKKLVILNSNSVFYVASQNFPESLLVGHNVSAFCIFASRRTVAIDFVWVHNGVETRNYSNSSYHKTQESSGYCGSFNPHHNYYIVKVSLHIYGVNLNDTGQYQCLARDTRSNDVIIAKSPLQHINIIFYELPSPTIYLFTTRKTVLKCGIKSLFPVSVYWSHNGILLPFINTTQCNNSDHNIFMTLQTEQLHNGSAIYNLQLHFCHVNMSHEGEYHCGVNGSEISKVVESYFSVILVSIPTSSTFIPLATGTTSTVHYELVLALPLVCIGLILLVGIPLIFLLIRLCYSYKYNIKSEQTKNNDQTNSSMLKWELPKQSLRYIDDLGVGHFGQVYKAKIEGLEDDHFVAVKTITDRKGTFELLNELEIMKKIQPHPNICNLRGQCTTSEGPPCIVLEYAVHGSLKQFLLTCRNTVLESEKPLKIISKGQLNVTASYDHIKHNIPCDHKTCLLMEERQHRIENIGSSGYLCEEDVYYMADQITKGLFHLENHKILHRDISARNILISEGFIMKVADFGFSRNITEKEYYRSLTNGAIPVKWVAIEALERQVYTYKSDVWSFGVLLWEILSYGETPYKNIDLSCGWEEFLKELKNGLRLSKPDGCSDDLYNVMMCCWETEPQTRPSFSDLQNVFQQFLEQ